MNQKTTIDEAILKARRIALEEDKDDIYTINTSSYSFVITLLTKFKDSLKEIKNDTVNDQTYNSILKVLES